MRSCTVGKGKCKAKGIRVCASDGKKLVCDAVKPKGCK